MASKFSTIGANAKMEISKIKFIQKTFYKMQARLKINVI
jgi:hypothetical protein